MSETLHYDEDNAIRFIRGTLPDNVNMQYADDDILYIIDIIWEWYDKKGFLNLDSEVTEEEEHNLDELTAYVKKQLSRDKEYMLDTKDVGLIVKGEIEYEKTVEDIY